MKASAVVARKHNYFKSFEYLLIEKLFWMLVKAFDSKEVKLCGLKEKEND